MQEAVHKRHGSPLWIPGEGGERELLNRQQIMSPECPESWLQETLFNHPEVLPFKDLEPVFFCGSLTNRKDMLLAFSINAHGGDHQVIAKCKPIDEQRHEVRRVQSSFGI